MKKTFAVLAATLLCQAALADGIQVSDAYAYPTVQGNSQGGIFVSLTNTDATDNKLMGASVNKNIAQTTELHIHVHENGKITGMVEVQGGIPLPAGQTQMLKRGGYHVMVFGLAKPLSVGDKFPMTLKFQNGKPQTVTVTVQPHSYKPAGQQDDAAASEPAHHHMHSH